MVAFQGLAQPVRCKQGNPPDAVSASSWEIKNNYTTFPICQMQAMSGALGYVPFLLLDSFTVRCTVGKYAVIFHRVFTA